MIIVVLTMQRALSRLFVTEQQQGALSGLFVTINTIPSAIMTEIEEMISYKGSRGIHFTIWTKIYIVWKNPNAHRAASSFGPGSPSRQTWKWLELCFCPLAKTDSGSGSSIVVLVGVGVGVAGSRCR